MMRRKMFYLFFVFVLFLVSVSFTNVVFGDQTVPFSLQAVGDITIDNGPRWGQDENSNGSGLEARDVPDRRHVFLLSYDISSLKGRGPVSNVSLSNFSHNLNDEVNVYGVIEDLDLLDVESLTWNTAPGVKNDPAPELNSSVVTALDMNELTDVLLTFSGPGEQGVRFSTGTSQALDDFINSDTDGIITLLVAPSAEGNQLIVRSREHSAGGTFLEGDVAPIANVIWVSDNAKYDFDANQPADAGFVNLLRAQGYNVDYKGEVWPYDPDNDNITLNPDRFYWRNLDPNKIDELNAADLVIISRIADSGQYDDKPDPVGGINECIGWNSVTTPMISMSAHLARSGYDKWGWLNCSGHPYITDNVHNILDPNHPIFEGIVVDANSQADLLTDEYTVNGSDAVDSGNGITLATRVADNAIMIAYWDAGVEYFDGSGYFAGGPRMFFAAGSGNGSPRDGIYNLTADGEIVFLNAVKYMLPMAAVDPGTDALTAYYPLDIDLMDASGNGHDGTAFGDPTFVEAVLDMGLEFDGDDYVDTGYTDDLPTWTVSAWIKSPAAPAAGSSCGPVHRESNYQINWNHYTPSWRGSIGTNVNGEWYSASLGAIEADTWYYLVGTYDGENLKAYKDGVLVTDNDSPSGDPMPESNSLKLGRHAASERFFTGTIDEVRIYNRALSDAEVIYLANN